MRKFLLCLCLLLSSLVVFAAPKPHTIDKSHSAINFSADSLVFTAQGFFSTWDAEVQLDAEKIENSTLKITIDAASINTRNERRDNHLRSADFFDVANHPKITFVSKSITKTGAQNYNVTGDLTIRGTTKSVTVPLEVVFYENNRGRFRGSFSINRKEFGVNGDSRLNPIKDIVQIQLDVNVRAAQEPTKN